MLTSLIQIRDKLPLVQESEGKETKIEHEHEGEDDGHLHYSAKPSFIPEFCRLFTAWWLRIFMFPMRHRMKLENVDDWLKRDVKFVIIDARREGNEPGDVVSWSLR